MEKFRLVSAGEFRASGFDLYTKGWGVRKRLSFLNPTPSRVASNRVHVNIDGRTLVTAFLEVDATRQRVNLAPPGLSLSDPSNSRLNMLWLALQLQSSVLPRVRGSTSDKHFARRIVRVLEPLQHDNLSSSQISSRYEDF